MMRRGRGSKEAVSNSSLVQRCCCERVLVLDVGTKAGGVRRSESETP